MSFATHIFLIEMLKLRPKSPETLQWTAKPGKRYPWLAMKSTEVINLKFKLCGWEALWKSFAYRRKNISGKYLYKYVLPETFFVTTKFFYTYIEETVSYNKDSVEKIHYKALTTWQNTYETYLTLCIAWLKDHKTFFS